MMDVMFNVPSDESIEKVIITEDAAKEIGEPTIIYNEETKKQFDFSKSDSLMTIRLSSNI